MRSLSSFKGHLKVSGYFSNPLFLISSGVIIALIFLSIGYVIGKSQYSPKQQFVEIEPTVSPTPRPTPEPTATPSPAPTAAAIVTPSKLALHIDAIKWEDGHAAGLASDVKVRLYTMDDVFIEEKTPSPYVQKGPIGTGGDTVFYVLPSTYKLVAETDSTRGTCTVTVRATTEYNTCAIYLVKK